MVQKPKVGTKLFVLDTNVLMHDSSCIFRFEEHDIYIPMVVLEELDNHKKGMTEVARNVREVSRTFRKLLDSKAGKIEEGIPLTEASNGQAMGRLYLQTKKFSMESSVPLVGEKNDNEILLVVRALREGSVKRNAVLVSKDINLYIKACALGVPVEDYTNDTVLEDTDLVYRGIQELPHDFWETHRDVVVKKVNGFTQYRVHGAANLSFAPNEFVHGTRPDGKPLYARVCEVRGRHLTLSTFEMHLERKSAVWGIRARNHEQGFALHLLLNPDIDIVTLMGPAGTGKTLLALVAGLKQTFLDGRYNEIIVTRATVPVGEDIGYLPGSEVEKMEPWMGALQDNLDLLYKNNPAKDWGQKTLLLGEVRSRVSVKSLGLMRGRTFINKYLIIDEAQNLTPKQIKMLMTRAGEGTKVVCLGNIAQIDTPYLTEGSSGLTYAVERYRPWQHSGHVTLVGGERSRLATYSNEVL